MRVEAFILGRTWDEIRGAASAAEAAGFDAVASPEITSDPFLNMAMAAGATERIQLRTAIAVAFPRSPMVVANQSWDIQVNSGGRFALGLGTQVKPHNERRFSVPWVGKPARRLTEYVESLRAIWRCWELEEPLSYEGEHYRFSLMTPEFRPPPSKLAPIPVYTAAVRPAMMRVAGRVADGVRLHGFCTRRYLEEVALAEIGRALDGAGRERGRFEVCGGGFVATGPDAERVGQMAEWVRYRVAFYGSTPSYWPVLEIEGLEDLGKELNQMSREGRWDEMASRVTDEVLDLFVCRATYDELPAALEKRFGGLSDSIELALPGDDVPAGRYRELLEDIRRIPTRFEGHPTTWDA